MLAALAIISAVLGAPGAMAQSYLIDTYSVDEGLPSSEVFSVAQDTLGRVWFSTRNGMVVFDGLHWTPVQVPRRSPGSRTGELMADRQGRVWATSSDVEHLLNIVSGDRWGTFGPAVAIPCPLLEDDESVAVVGAALRESEDGPVVAVAVADVGLLVYDGEGWDLIDEARGMPPGGIRGVTAAGDGFLVATDRVLVRVVDQLVVEVAPGAIPAEALPLLAVDVVEEHDPEAPIWILGRDRLMRLTGGAAETVATGFELYEEEPYTSKLLVTDHGCAFLGQRHRLFHVEIATGEIELLGRGNGMIADGVVDLIEDRESNLWVVNLRGVSKLVSQRFANYGQKDGLLEDEVSAICEPAPGRLVFGHNSGLTLFDRGRARRLPFPISDALDAIPPRVMDLKVSPRGVLVAGSFMGLGVLTAGETVTWFPTEREDSINAVLVTPDEILAGGTWLYRFDGRKLERLSWPTLEWGAIRRLAARSDGAELIASNRAGLIVRGKDGALHRVEGPEGQHWNSSFTVLEDRRGRVWLGTSSGLLQLVGERLQEPPQAELRIRRPVYQVLEDDLGHLWFGTDDGVARWDGSGLTWLRPRDGLTGRETNRAAAHVDAAGRVWIGTETGVSAFRRDHDRWQTRAPAVRIVGVEIEGLGEAGPGAVEVAHDHDTVTFHYVAVSFLDEAGLEYRARLDGFDREWSAPLVADQRSLRYTSLPPGSYRFDVQARLHGGPWSATASSASITIARPLWTTWWFRGGAAVLVLGLVVGVFQGVVRWRYVSRLVEENRLRRAAEEQTRAILAELEASRADFVAIAEKGRDGLLIVDAAGRVQFANTAACALLDLDKGRVFGASVGFDPDATEELPIRLPDGEEGVAELRVAPTEWQGGSARLVLLRDVTDLRRTSEHLRQTQKLEAVGKLAGGVAHDFNNLLQALLSLIASLRLAASDPERRTALISELESHIKLGSSVTRRLLLFSRRDQPRHEAIDLRTVVSDSLTLLHRLVRENIKIVVELGEVELAVEGDPDQLSQVITNLALNASDAMPEGGTLTVRAGAESEERVWFEVEDTGVGIPPHLRDKVFEPFFTTKGRERGTGLGLSVVHGIVTRHGGTVEAVSREGNGSRFRVTLPCSRGESAGSAEDTVEATTPEVMGRGERLILVEDDEAIRTGLEEVLTRLGYEVVSVVSAEEAQRHLDGGCDVLVTDLILPGMRGDELALELRRRWPELPVVIISGYTEDETAQLALQVEAARFLFKPFSMDRLGAAIREALKPSSSGTWAVVEEDPTDEGEACDILVVEDDPTIQALMRGFLDQVGYRVKVVAEAESALALVRDGTSRPGLVITDLSLPVMNGDELLRRCRELDPDLPFIITSGDPMALGEFRQRNEERIGVLAKPFDVFDLEKKVTRFLPR